jgi:hypothetical protein
MINQEGLQSRVKLAGAIPHEQARDFLVGDADAVHFVLLVEAGIHVLFIKEVVLMCSRTAVTAAVAGRAACVSSTSGCLAQVN